MRPYWVRVGPRVVSLRELIFSEEPGKGTSVEPGHLVVTMRPGITLDFEGDEALEMKGYIERARRLFALPPECAAEGGLSAVDPDSGAPLPPDPEPGG